MSSRGKEKIRNEEKVFLHNIKYLFLAVLIYMNTSNAIYNVCCANMPIKYFNYMWESSPWFFLDEGEQIPIQTHAPPPTNPSSDDVNIHVHKEDGTGGGICAKLVFFVLLSALVVVIGMIITQYRGLTDGKCPKCSIEIFYIQKLNCAPT